MRKVVYFSGIPFFQMKSMEICAKSIIQELRNLGVDVHEVELTLASRFSKAKPKILWEFIFRYIVYPISAFRTGKHFGSTPVYILGDHANAFLLLFLPQNSCTILQLNDLTSLRPIKKLPFKPLWQNYLIHIIGLVLKKPGIQCAKKVVTISEYIKKDAIHYLGIPSDRIKVIWLGLNHSAFRPLDKIKSRRELGLPVNGKIVMTIAPPTPRKNIQILIRALYALKRQKYPITLILVGDFDPTSRKLITKFNLENYIQVVNNLSIEELVLYYNSADIYVFPSLYEGFGLPLVEAMACGTPILASNESSLPEVLTDAGLYFHPRDWTELSHLMLKLFNNKKLRDSLSKRGIQRAQSFSWARTAKKFKQLIDSFQ